MVVWGVAVMLGFYEGMRGGESRVRNELGLMGGVRAIARSDIP